MDTITLPTPLVVNKKGFEIESFPVFSPSLYDGLKGKSLKDEFSWYLSLCIYTDNNAEYRKHWAYTSKKFGLNRVITSRIHNKAIAWHRLYEKLNKNDK